MIKNIYNSLHYKTAHSLKVFRCIDPGGYVAAGPGHDDAPATLKDAQLFQLFNLLKGSRRMTAEFLQGGVAPCIKPDMPLPLTTFVQRRLEIRAIPWKRNH